MATFMANSFSKLTVLRKAFEKRNCKKQCPEGGRKKTKYTRVHGNVGSASARPFVAL